MAIDPVTGDLYLLDIAGTNPNETLLWRVDKTDATAVNLGITGLDRPQGVAFDPGMNELYIAKGGFVDPAPQGLYTFDPNDLSMQFIGKLDYLGVGGMAFTPEPSMLLLFGVSGFRLINQREFKR